MIIKLINAAIENKIIKENERQMYYDGILSLCFSAMTWGTLVLIGIALRLGYQCLLYLMLFIPLRMFAGGNHQSTRKKCFLASLVTFAILFIGASDQWITSFISVYSIMIFPSLLIIWVLSPVEDLNKPLYPKEIKHHRKTARIILAVEMSFILLLNILQIKTYLYFSLSAINLVAVLLLTGEVKNRCVNKES